MLRLFAPDGETPITGTKELVPGNAGVSGAKRNADGSLELEYAGGTEMYWDDSKTVMRGGERVFIDEDGDEWLESELVIKEDGE